MSRRRAMIRKQLYIEYEQNMLLREQAAKYEVSEGQIVRDAIDAYFTVSMHSQEIDLHAWKEERLFIDSRQKDRATSGTKTWTRDELYDR